MKKRRVIQLAFSDSTLLVLCDDGTIWRWEHRDGWGWFQFKDVPQPPHPPPVTGSNEAFR